MSTFFFHELTKVEALTPYRLRTTWNTGEVLDVDVEAALRSAPDLAPILDPAVFATVHIGEWGGTVEWRDSEFGADNVYGGGQRTKIGDSMASAEEFVNFYYFWLNEYKERYFLIKKAEIQNKYRNILDDARPKNYYTMSSVDRDNDDACKKYDEIVGELYKKEDNEIYKIYENFSSWKFSIQAHDEGITTGGDLIEEIYSNGNIEHGGNEVQRLDKNFGIDVLGNDGFALNSEGKLQGGLIVRLDLSTPLPCLLKEISKIKSLKFENIPTHHEIARVFEREDTDYELEREIIRQTDGVSIASLEDAPRALGLWIFDVMHENKFKSVAEAIRHLKSGDEFEKDILDILGYSISDMTVFQRLYRKTKQCVEMVEVLPLK